MHPRSAVFISRRSSPSWRLQTAILRRLRCVESPSPLLWSGWLSWISCFACQGMDLLNGRWKLVYTSSPQALAVLGLLRRIPLVSVGAITQVIDSHALTVENKVDIAVPFVLSLSTRASFEVGGQVGHYLSVPVHGIPLILDALLLLCRSGPQSS